MAFFSMPQSAAIKIVNPNDPRIAATLQDGQQRPPSRKDSSLRTCKYILANGSCPFQEKGCMFYHPPAQDTAASSVDSPVTSIITAEAINAPVFVPRSTTLMSGRSSPAVIDPNKRAFTVPAPTSSTPVQFEQPQQPQEAEQPNPHDPDLYASSAQFDSQFYADHQYNGYATHEFGQPTDASFFAPTSQIFASEPLNYHLYSQPIPPAFVVSSTDSHFVPPSNELRQILQEKNEAVRSIPAVASNLPEELHGYHSLVSTDEPNTSERRKFNSWFSSAYRAVNSNDGITYTLQRVENFRLMNSVAFGPIETWTKIQHPSIVSIHEAFTTRSFGDNSLIVVYAFQPKAQTLYDLHIKSSPPTFQQSFNQRSQILVQNQPTPIPLRTLWSYVVQISMAIKKVHEHNLAIRTIDATRILVTGKNRIRISGCGVLDILLYDSRMDIHQLQLDDLTHFGRLIFALCCNNLSAAIGPNFQKSLDFIHRTYGTEVKNLALFLISKPAPHKTVQALFELILPHLCDEIDEAIGAADRLETELLSELENARLVRLLCKFGFINERPEFARDLRWSDTGDRYVIKLFRDYVFHQVNEQGNPVTDLTHVLTCLNKLDAGTEEKILLIARDEQSCVVASYKEIKNCVESAFNELSQASNTTTTFNHGYR